MPRTCLPCCHLNACSAPIMLSAALPPSPALPLPSKASRFCMHTTHMPTMHADAAPCAGPRPAASTSPPAAPSASALPGRGSQQHGSSQGPSRQQHEEAGPKASATADIPPAKPPSQRCCPVCRSGLCHLRFASTGWHLCCGQVFVGKGWKSGDTGDLTVSKDTSGSCSRCMLQQQCIEVHVGCRWHLLVVGSAHILTMVLP